jgi:amidase
VRELGHARPAPHADDDGAPIPTGRIDGRSDASSYESWADASYRWPPYTELFNVTGQPAISLPLSESQGLPIGAQLAARLGDDAMLLALSAGLEREFPWQARSLALARRYLR